MNAEELVKDVKTCKGSLCMFHGRIFGCHQEDENCNA